MSSGSHGRDLGKMARGLGSGRRKDDWIEVADAAEKEYQAVRAIVAFALALAGTDKLPPPPPTWLAGNSTTILVPDPPVLPPCAQPPRWTKEVRPGPHDVLTWEEAMQVPWFDPFAETER